MRLRTSRDRLKTKHSIIDGVRDILETLLKETHRIIRSAIPGVIRSVRDAKRQGTSAWRMTSSQPGSCRWPRSAMASSTLQASP